MDGKGATRMRLTPATLGGAALLLLLSCGGAARADLIQWSYNWSRSPANVMADSPGTGYISLTDETLQNAVGNSDIVATNIQAHSTATAADPDHFTNTPYTLSLYLLDKQSGSDSTLKFTGVFNGTLTALSSNIKAAFTSPTTQTAILGGNVYTVTVGAYTPPGPTGSSTSGSIGAHSMVSVEVVVQDLPEPATLTLATLGLPLLGAVAWRRRLRPLAALQG
jgi:hypothetical protein